MHCKLNTSLSELQKCALTFSKYKTEDIIYSKQEATERMETGVEWKLCGTIKINTGALTSRTDIVEN